MPSSVDCILVPLGTVMVIGLVAGRALSSGIFCTTKWPVAPESGIKVNEVAGGPDEFIEDKLICKLFLSSGSPPFHSFFDSALVWERRRRDAMLVHPPIILSNVASFLCPSNGLLHDSDMCFGLRPSPCDQQ